MLTTAKHFPGHGDTAVDSHLQLPTLPHDRERLAAIELKPFRGAIAAGVDAVMTAHLRVPSLDAHRPATLAPAVLTTLLRQDLGFDGLVVTDAMIMGAIAQHYGAYEAAVLALEAGADVILMPADPAGTIAAISEAVRIGRLTPERILTSVERVWRAKQKVSSSLTVPPATGHAWEHVPPPPIDLKALATPAAQQLVTQIAVASQTVRGQVPPALPMAQARSLIIVDDVLNTAWLDPQAPAIALPAAQGYAPRLLDTYACSLPPGHPGAPQTPTLLQIFSRGNPFRGSAGISDLALSWFRLLQDTACLRGLVVYGSPYVLTMLRSELLADVPFGFSFGQMPAAQSAILTVLLAQATSQATATVFTD